MKKLRLFRKDVLIEPFKKNDLNSSIIHIVEEDEGKQKLNYFKVLQVSEKVTMVNVGDVVLIEHLDHTVPMLFNDTKCAVTSEDDIVAVIEK
jgi:co-chaperonin GroES (HSP10)